MKIRFTTQIALLMAGIFSGTTVLVHAADFTVTNSGFVFFINDARYPTLTLVRGVTYTSNPPAQATTTSAAVASRFPCRRTAKTFTTNALSTANKCAVTSLPSPRRKLKF